MDLHAYFGNASTSAEKTDSISDSSLSSLMKIVIETNLEVIVDIRNRKGRRIAG